MNKALQVNLSLEKDEHVSSASQENIKISIAKTISWRLISTLTLAFTIGV